MGKKSEGAFDHGVRREGEGQGKSGARVRVLLLLLLLLFVVVCPRCLVGGRCGRKRMPLALLSFCSAARHCAGSRGGDHRGKALRREQAPRKRRKAQQSLERKRKSHERSAASAARRRASLRGRGECCAPLRGCRSAARPQCGAGRRSAARAAVGAGPQECCTQLCAAARCRSAAHRAGAASSRLAPLCHNV